MKKNMKKIVKTVAASTTVIIIKTKLIYLGANYNKNNNSNKIITITMTTTIINLTSTKTCIYRAQRVDNNNYHSPPKTNISS